MEGVKEDPDAGTGLDGSELYLHTPVVQTETQ